MGKMEQVLRSEIQRLARKEIRAASGPLAKQVRELKREVKKLSKALEARSKEAASEKSKAAPPALKADPAEVEKARFSGNLVRKLRKRLGISQAELATLADVSGTTISFWEQGRTRPSDESKAVIVALRKLGRRDVKKLLEAKQ
jgi:DNA-binding transcriptional regulator YiaG